MRQQSGCLPGQTPPLYPVSVSEGGSHVTDHHLTKLCTFTFLEARIRSVRQNLTTVFLNCTENSLNDAAEDYSWSNMFELKG